MTCNFTFLQRSIFSILAFVVYLNFIWVGNEVLGGSDASDLNSYQLQTGNRLEIIVYREEDLSGVYEIDPSGKLAFPLIGEIEAAGLGIEVFREQLILRLKKYLVDPQINISRTEDTARSISVLGHVAKPGIYDYAPGSTLMRLISTAGGFTESSNKRKIKIVRMVNGEKKAMVVNSLDIINGNSDDLKLESGDIIFIPESIF